MSHFYQPSHIIQKEGLGRIGMDKNDSSNIYEALRKHLETKNSQKVFNPLVPELAEIFYLHYTLIENINKVLAVHGDENLHNEMEQIKITLEHNIEGIINIIGGIAHRKIVLLKAIDNSTIRSISKNYNSDLREIYELNNIKSIFPSEEKRALLIPLKL